ncbi:MAG: MerR family transcriptional regulator [Rhodospirillales bacterium]|nr:MerR family transcriptional regulator [Rhodospirillales bacterium]
MPAPVRTAGGHRVYTQDHLDWLAFIRHARELGFSLEAELVRMVAACGHGRVAECRVIDVLADQSHAHCLHDGHGGTGL